MNKNIDVIKTFLRIVSKLNIEDINIKDNSIIIYSNNVSYQYDNKEGIINIFYSNKKPNLKYKDKYIYFVEL
jgi:hypothetical protein